MANVIRIKRRASRDAGAPASLKAAELMHNEVKGTLYIGKNDDRGGHATSIVALADSAAFADLSTIQTLDCDKTLPIVPKLSRDTFGRTDLMRRSQMDTLLARKAPFASLAMRGTTDRPYGGTVHQHAPDRHHSVRAGRLVRTGCGRHVEVGR
jgi:hypothetical protein